MSKAIDAKRLEPKWVVPTFKSGVHVVALASLFFYRPSLLTHGLVLALAVFAGFGITMGYHRLWSHKAFDAHWSVKLILMIAGTVGMEGSIIWWSLRHRLHHRYTDTEHDPYDATRGLWYSHMGWLFEYKNYERIKYIERTDLNNDPIVQFQHKNYRSLALFWGWIFPTLVASYWGDALGGFLYGGFVVRILIWHATWTINSLAHYWGEQEYSQEHTSRKNLLLALLTMGEGNHNHHHEFPRDYRNGLDGDWDPVKWMINFLAHFGLCFDMITTPAEVTMKAKVNVLKEKMNVINKDLKWTDEDSLPIWSKQDFDRECKSRDLFLINGFAIDYTQYKKVHPGGDSLLLKLKGKDATKSFFGILNNHTKSARQIVTDLRCAKVSVSPSLSAPETDIDDEEEDEKTNR